MAAALKAVAGAFAGHPRHLASGAPGTIERAIAAYVPGVFRPVEEGGTMPRQRKLRRAVPARHAGLVSSAVCVDRYEASVVERAPDGTLLSHAPNLPLAPDHVYLARSVPGIVPQAYVSGAQAPRGLPPGRQAPVRTRRVACRVWR